MRRLILICAIFFYFAPCAMATERYVDNRLVASGTATGGADATHMDLGSPTYGSGFAQSDLQYCGLIIMSGTGAPSSVTHFKITSNVGNIVAVSPGFGATPSSNWVYRVHYGCDANTVTYATPTKGASVGPALDIQTAYEQAASGDRVNIKNSGRTYDEAYITNKYLNLWKNETRTIQGFNTTAGDLDESGTIAATYTGVWRLSSSASQARTLTASYPIIAPSHVATSAMYIQGANTHTFRNLTFRESGAQTQLWWLISAQTNALITFDQCNFGAGAIATQSGIIDASSSGQSIRLVVTNCKFNLPGSAVKMVFNNSAVITGCEITRPSPNASTGAIELNVAATTTLAYDATAENWYSSNQTRRLEVDSCYFNETGTEATYTYPIVVQCTSSTNGPRYMEHVKITRNRIYTKRAGPIYLSPLPSAEIGYNLLYTDSANGASDLIQLAPDATPTATPGSETRLPIKRGLVGTGSTSTVSPGVDGTIVLASDSAVDNAYRGLFVTIYTKDGAAVNTREVLSFTNSSDTITYDANTGGGTDNAPISPTPVNGDIYEIWQMRPHAIFIHHNYGEMLQTNVGEGHLVLIGQGWDNVKIIGNTFLGGASSNNGIVAKGRAPVILFNTVRAGRGCMLVKGAGDGTMMFNTFQCQTANGGGGCLDWQDKSTYAVSGATAALFNGAYQRPTGWWVTDNIFEVKGTATICINDNQADIGTLAMPRSIDPLAESNYFDYNVIFRDDNGDGASDHDASHPIASLDNANVTDLAALKTKWTDTTYQTTFALNDAHSLYGGPQFVNAAGGNFALKPLSTARRASSVASMNIGAWQSYGRSSTPGVYP